MAAYTQIGYGGYPSATQLVSAGSGSSPHIGDLSTQQSTEAPSQSSARECCSTVPAVIDTSSGAMSPDGMSQTSNAGATGTGTAVVSTNLALPADVPSPAHVATTASACCENGRPIVTDPVSGQTVCSCQYDARIALSSYSRLPAAGVGVYGTPYPSTDQNPYQSIGVDSSAFYPPLSNPYALKDSTTGAEMTAWTSAGLQPTTGYYSYDPMAPYGYGASYDLAARRKNATRESTATLKAWLNEHKKNPYPTKGEKIMLAIITKMTLTQVSTWFANARRRLKKENKMTWEPKNRTDDDDDALASDDDKDKDEVEAKKSTSEAVLHERIVGELTVVSEIRKDPHNLQPKPVQGRQPDDEDLQLAMREQDMRPIYPGAGYHGGGVSVVDDSHHHPYHPYHHQHPAYYQHQQVELTGSYHPSSQKEAHTDPKNQQSRDYGVPIPATKPKIWSLADTVACKTPPPPTSPAFLGQQQATPLHMNSHSMPVSPFHQQQPQKLQQEISQFHMAADYTTVAFSRGHTVVYGGLLGSSGRSHYHDRTSSSTSSTNNLATTPTTINPLDQPQLQQQHPHQHQHQQLQSHLPHAMQQQMGFPEVQPETPPQTPPNMKVQNLAVNLLLTGPRTSMTHTCHSANQAYDAISLAGRLGARFGGYSLEEDSYSRSSSGSEGMSINSAEQFQPILKSQRMAEFVSTI